VKYGNKVLKNSWKGEKLTKAQSVRVCEIIVEKNRDYFGLFVEYIWSGVEN